MKVHALVFFDPQKLQPLDHKIYTQSGSKYETRFIKEFVEFGRKEFIQRLQAPDKNFVISVANGHILIYVTILSGNNRDSCDDVGVAMMVSNVEKLDDLLHIVSRKLISDYLIYNIIPNESDIIRYCKLKEILLQIDDSKKVLLRTMSKVMDRGDSLEELIEMTDTLSKESKVFFRNSRRLNSCCWIFPRPKWK